MNIPETTQSLAGYLADFGDTPGCLNNPISQESLPIISLFGNRCGHVPHDPRFYLRPEHHKRRPSVLEKAISTLESAYHLPKKFLRAFTHLNPKNRRKRSERREAVTSVSQVLLHYLDLVTLRTGFYNSQGRFVPLDLEYISKKAGINFIRAKRAVADLVRAGYIKVSRQFDKKEDGTFKGFPSIREVSVSFFIDLGMDIQRLFFAREWKRKKQEKEFSQKKNKKLSGLLRAVSSWGGKRSFPKRFTSKKQISLAIDTSKNLINRALELHQSNPERTPSDYLKELRRLNE